MLLITIERIFIIACLVGCMVSLVIVYSVLSNKIRQLREQIQERNN